MPTFSDQAVEPAEPARRFADHALHVALARDVGLDRERAPARAHDLRDGLLRARALLVRDRNVRALAREQPAHRAPVPDRIAGRVEHTLPAANDQHAPAREPPAARRLP